MTHGDEANHAPDVEWMALEGITTGWEMSDGTREYRGLRNVARCDLAAFLYRMAGSPSMSSTAVRAQLARMSDVDESTLHYVEVCWMAREGITTGWPNPDGTFRFMPYGTVARQDMAAFLHRFAYVLCGEDEADSWATGRASLTDVDFYDEKNHGPDVAWLAETGISAGFPDGTFRGGQNVARQDMAAFMKRLYDYMS